VADEFKEHVTNQSAVTDQAVYSVRTVGEVPVIYADGIRNQIRSNGISKMHFFRDDSVAGKVSEYTKVEVLQLIMPALGFAEMVAFLEHRLNMMIESGQVNRTQYEERKKFYADTK
jgi:hypothetical protein